MSYDDDTGPDDMETAHDAQEAALNARAAKGKGLHCSRCGLTLYRDRHICLQPIDEVLGATRTGPSIAGNGDEDPDDIQQDEIDYQARRRRRQWVRRGVRLLIWFLVGGALGLLFDYFMFYK